jgi:hypothetical protein
LHPDAVVISGEDRAEREAATVAAMQSSAPLVLGGRLPTDYRGRRTGEPDVLVKVRGSPSYRAVDIKHHRTQEQGPSGIEATAAPLNAPELEASEARSGGWARKHRTDMLQLAHYERMLEGAGLASPGGRFGGVIGVEGEVVWYDLDAAVWLTPSSTGKRKRRTTMEIYDFEFDFRLDIMAIAMAHRADPSIVPLVVQSASPNAAPARGGPGAARSSSAATAT